MDKFLSELVRYQSASVTIRPASDDLNEYLEGELQILVKGTAHAFVAEGQTIETVTDGLGHKYLCHDWSKTDPPVVLIAVHGGMAELVNDPDCVVIIADYDHLENNGCPVCPADLGETGRQDRLCPECGFMWEESDE